MPWAAWRETLKVTSELFPPPPPTYFCRSFLRVIINLLGLSWRCLLDSSLGKISFQRWLKRYNHGCILFAINIPRWRYACMYERKRERNKNRDTLRVSNNKMTQGISTIAALRDYHIKDFVSFTRHRGKRLLHSLLSPLLIWHSDPTINICDTLWKWLRKYFIM